MNQQQYSQEVLNSPPIKVKKPWVTPEVSESPIHDLTSDFLSGAAADATAYS